MKAPSVMLFKRSDIRRFLTLRDCISAVEDAFRLHAEGKTLAPGLLHIDSENGEFHIKAGGIQLDRIYFGLKANGGFFGNMAKHGLPNIQGLILLYDGDTGCPLAVMDSIEITIQRTGAATAVAAKYLARPDSRTAAIFGCGNQGRVQLKALKEALPGINMVYAFDRDEKAALRYAAEMTAELGIPVVSTPDLCAVKECDAVVTCTPSRQFFLRKDLIQAGTFIAAVGADSPEKQELEPSLMAGTKVVVDILEQCASVGELHHALEAGLITRQDVHGELGQVITGQVPGRTSADEIIVYDATGTALQDAAAAAVVYNKALRPVNQSAVLTLDIDC